ncbi:hypothetical protein [Paraburkholderia sp. EG304]|uniref:hypothetical protein n=1 Tax=Paraburkholderia sp. EG304 TaxID=3237015 RepID=UPI0039789ADE
MQAALLANRKSGRTAHLDPNDHRYDNKIKKVIQALRPDHLSILSGGGDNDEPPDAMGGTVEIDSLRGINDAA